jgi:cyclomaltodextrinase
MPAMMQYASAAPVATRGSVRARPLDPPRVIAMSFSPIGPRKKLTVLASVSNVYRCHGNPPPPRAPSAIRPPSISDRVVPVRSPPDPSVQMPARRGAPRSAPGAPPAPPARGLLRAGAIQPAVAPSGTARGRWSAPARRVRSNAISQDDTAEPDLATSVAATKVAVEGTSLAETAAKLEALTKDPEAEAKKKKKKLRKKKAALAEEDAEKAEEEEEEEEPEPELTYWEKVPAPPPRPPVAVTFHIDRDTNFGDHLCIVGGHDLLGKWVPAKGIEMDWVEGTKWKVTVHLPAHSLIQYKYVIRSGWSDDGPATWQGGPDCLIATGAAHSSQEIRDVWTEGDWGDGNPNVAAIPAAVAAHEKVKTPEEWEYSNKENKSYLPEWANDAVFYQIFPLGYFGAPTVNDGKSKVQPRMANIRNHYKHFQELGIDAVYFSPLFESGTHGYDTFDYFEIDRRLGDVKLFKEIVKELHEIGIKVVLDGVFNHTGKGHFAFQDLMKCGASDSEFSNWYHVGVRRWDYEGWCDAKSGSSFSYDCWEGHPVLPRLNLKEPAVRNHIFDVAKFWLEEVGIDGWRLDVAHEIEPDFWREFRAVCDSVDKDCLLVGEMIHGNYNDWVGHDRLHSGTNYQMSHATWHSLNEHNYEYFYNALLRENNLFNGLTLVNFLGNHDVPRIASNLDNPAHYTHAMVVMLLMKGIPCLYYGDEFGMEGTPADGTDEHSGGDDAMRRPMPDTDKPGTWPAVGVSRLALNKKLMKIRKDHPVFSNAGSQDIKNINLLSQEWPFEQITVLRETEDEVGILVFNCADHEVNPWPEVQLPPNCIAKKGAKFVDLLAHTPETFLVNDGGKVYAGPCGPNSVKVLLYEKPKPKPPPPSFLDQWKNDRQ